MGHLHVRDFQQEDYQDNHKLGGSSESWRIWKPDSVGRCPNGGSDIYLQDLSTKKQTRLTNDGSSWTPAIYGKKIVWNAADSLTLYDITTKKKTALGGGTIGEIAIYGNRIIFNNYYNEPVTGMYDFSTKKWIELPFEYVADPSFYGNKIVYT